MANVPIHKTSVQEKAGVSIFEELEKRWGAVRDRAFHLFQNRGGELGRDLEDWLAAEREIMGTSSAEIAEKDGGFEIQIALPGFEAKDVSVTATPQEIAVHAKSRRERKSGEGQTEWSEFESADICRSFGLSDEIDVEKLKAVFEKGSLRITAPKVAAGEPKAVAVKAG